MEQTFDLPARRVLNDLVYLKAKAEHEAEVIKKSKNG
jgi:hypothetical protein